MTNIPNKTFLVLMIGAASLAVFGPMASANTMRLTLNYGSRQSGIGGEFNVSSPDFVPATMGYAAAATFNGGFETFCVEMNEFHPRLDPLLRNQPRSHQWRRFWWQF
jgi:hypothetical protein